MLADALRALHAACSLRRAAGALDALARQPPGEGSAAPAALVASAARDARHACDSLEQLLLHVSGAREPGCERALAHAAVPAGERASGVSRSGGSGDAQLLRGVELLRERGAALAEGLGVVERTVRKILTHGRNKACSYASLVGGSPHTRGQTAAKAREPSHAQLALSGYAALWAMVEKQLVRLVRCCQRATELAGARQLQLDSGTRHEQHEGQSRQLRLDNGTGRQQAPSHTGTGPPECSGARLALPSLAQALAGLPLGAAALGERLRSPRATATGLMAKASEPVAADAFHVRDQAGRPAAGAAGTSQRQLGGDGSTHDELLGLIKGLRIRLDSGTAAAHVGRHESAREGPPLPLPGMGQACPRSRSGDIDDLLAVTSPRQITF